PRIYQIALERSVELLQRESHIKQLLSSATAAFPEKKDLFEQIVSGTMNPSSGSAADKVR
ncbi:MAG: hypothetical protein HY074_18075, partial [Deltaproteobacteria bacterium]|nr:hypothetical protein [Deltaproteobacteria bacterium]